MSANICGDFRAPANSTSPACQIPVARTSNKVTRLRQIQGAYNSDARPRDLGDVVIAPLFRSVDTDRIFRETVLSSFRQTSFSESLSLLSCFSRFLLSSFLSRSFIHGALEVVFRLIS